MVLLQSQCLLNQLIREAVISASPNESNHTFTYSYATLLLLQYLCYVPENYIFLRFLRSGGFSLLFWYKDYINELRKRSVWV